MAICPVCGCKTDEIDFVESKLSDTDIKICSFCNRQISGFTDGATASDGQQRWLSSVIAKDVPQREKWVFDTLCRLRAEFPPSEEISPEPVRAYNPDNSYVPPVQGNPADPALLERIEALEGQLKAMKRSLLVKSILEICIPVILAIIIGLIFVTSDLFDSLAEFYNVFIEM